MIAKTNCAGCVFLDVDKCKLHRMEKLGIAEKNENGDIILNRFCTTYRPKQWLDELSLSESVDLDQTVLNEVRPRVGFFIILDTGKDNSIQALDKTLECIKNQTMPARYVSVITDKVEYNNEIQSLFVQKFKFDETNYHIVQILEKPKVEEMLIDMSFRHAKNGWAYVCHSGEDIDIDLIQKIHNRINIELKRLVVVQPYDDKMNGLLFQTSLFKFLNGNGVKVFSDNVTDNRSFIDKVADTAKHSLEDTMITWESFNETT